MFEPFIVTVYMAVVERCNESLERNTFLSFILTLLLSFIIIIIIIIITIGHINHSFVLLLFDDALGHIVSHRPRPHPHTCSHTDMIS
jgi:hypothetical protein